MLRVIPVVWLITTILMSLPAFAQDQDLEEIPEGMEVIEIGQHLFTIDWNGSQHNIYLDSDTGSYISVNTPIQLNSRKLLINGRFGSSIFYFNGYIQEIILYASDQTANRTGIETNINDYYSIYTP